MSTIKLSNKIFELNLNPKEMSIYAYLCSLPSDYPMLDGTAVKVKQATIAQKCGIKAVQTVSKVIDTLAAKGLVIPLKRSIKANGYKGTYIYEVKKLPASDSFFFVDRAVFGQLVPRQMMIYLFICKSYSLQLKDSWNSYNDISRQTGMKRETIIETISELEQLKLIRKNIRYIEPWGKSFTYQVKDNKVFFNTGKAMEEVVTKGKSLDKYKALCELRDTTRELLEKQVTANIDYDLTPLRNKLNEQYDSFVKEYGNTTSKSIIKLFRKDADYPILAALESVDPDTKEVKKADIFTRRTVNPIKEITEVDTIEEAMQVSLDKKGKIDIGYMSWLLQNKYGDMDISSVAETIVNELLERELVFKDPAKIATGKPYAAIVDKSEYLCGDVRRKLIEAELAAVEDSSYSKNVEALKEIIPEDVS